MCFKKKLFFFLFGIITDMYTEQSQDKLRKMKAGIHREVLTGRAFCSDNTGTV